MSRHRYGEVALQHEELVIRFIVGFKVLRNVVERAVLSQGANELIRRDGQLGLKEGKPEDTSLLGGKGLTDGLCLVLVDDVLKVDLFEVVCPGVEHLEALVLHVLGAEPLYIVAHE